MTFARIAELDKVIAELSAPEVASWGTSSPTYLEAVKEKANILHAMNEEDRQALEASEAEAEAERLAEEQEEQRKSLEMIAANKAQASFKPEDLQSTTETVPGEFVGTIVSVGEPVVTVTLPGKPEGEAEHNGVVALNAVLEGKAIIEAEVPLPVPPENVILTPSLTVDLSAVDKASEVIAPLVDGVATIAGAFVAPVADPVADPTEVAPPSPQIEFGSVTA